jgi:SagB-type dehydrogenase family enzyme
MSARNRELAINHLGGSFVTRPYPSGGATYSLELYPVLAPKCVESIQAGVYRYLPEAHALELLSRNPSGYLPVLEAAGYSAGSSVPPGVFVITSRFAKVRNVYDHLAYSLVLKEVGALYQTLYLVAEYLELAACALGGGTPDDLFTSHCSLSKLEEPVVGEFMFGPREFPLGSD